MTTRLVLETDCIHGRMDVHGAHDGKGLIGPPYTWGCPGGSRIELDDETSIKFRNGFMYFVSDVLDALVEETTNAD